MTSDLSKITSGVGPSAARLQLLIDRALELYRTGPSLPLSEQCRARAEFSELLMQISAAARDTVEAFAVSADR
ncbi:hypothetical protein [Burkholderia multivorans]|uniref:hypothetical protein n=1 Tax=Burkholderia multivorans TaxID=87883 RepID=UPI000F4F94F8|nr:hypothetical protein [Burkholderia multivorans]MBU9118617.1 hypothetical protein [Burkholderia multivorans]